MYAAKRARIGGIALVRLWRPVVAVSAMAAVLLLFEPQTLVAALVWGAASYAVALVLMGAVRLRAGQIPVLSV